MLICGFVQAWLGWDGYQNVSLGSRGEGGGTPPPPCTPPVDHLLQLLRCKRTHRGVFSCTPFTPPPLLCPAVRSEHGIRYVKLPSASSTSSVLRFLENLCQYLESDTLFSSQPFSPFSSSSSNTRFYNRTKSGGFGTTLTDLSDSLHRINAVWV